MAWNTGLPKASDITAFFDNYGSAFELSRTTLGLGAPGEAGTVAGKIQAARAALLGDGTSGNPGLASDGFRRTVAPYLNSTAARKRYDSEWSTETRLLFIAVDSFIAGALPPAWNFAGGSQRFLDLYAARMNGTYNLSGVTPPAAPAAAATLTATTGGAIPSCSAGNAPRFVFTWVGSYDFLESMPSAESAQVALSGVNSAYNVAITGNAVTSRLRCYRSLVAGATGVYYWVGDVDMNAGQPVPTFKITAADQQLRQDLLPPSFMCCPLMPDNAFVFAASNLTAVQGTDQFGLPGIAPNGLLLPSNCVLGPSSGFLGINNVAASGIFGSYTQGSGFTAGAIQTANDSTQFVQGYIGATQVQARVTGLLDANATLTAINYTYYDAGHPYTAQNATIAGPLTLNAAVGQTVSLAVPAGRIVRSITGVTVAGITSGTFIFEGMAPRALP